MERSKIVLGHVCALFTIFLWGTTFVSTKVLLESFTPIEILFTRFVIGYLALLLFCPRRLHIQEPRQELLFAAGGFFGVTLYFLAENIALSYTYASNVGVITSIAPILIAILASLFLDGEGLKSRYFWGFGLAMAGIVLISFNGSLEIRTNLVGDLLALLAPVAWAFYSIIMRRIGMWGYHTVLCTRRVFFYGILFMIPALFLLDFRLELSRFAAPVNLLNLIYLGLGASALCFVIWNWAVNVLGAVKTGLYIYLIPIISVAASAVILGERITPYSAAGTVLIIIGVIASEGNLPFLKKRLPPG